MKEVKLYLNYAGYCFSKESHALRGGAHKPIKFHALYGLILHPVQGWILFDTGYTRRFYTATSHFPNNIYAKITQVHVNAEDELKSQLLQYKIQPSEIKHIILSHFHADHIGGMKDFENATFYCSKEAYKQINTINSYWGISKGILKDLIPENLNSRMVFIEDMGKTCDDVIFGRKFDLFSDQSIFVHELPGHAAGQIGIQLKTVRSQYFLIADACWLKESYTHFVLPHPMVRLIVDSWKMYLKTLQKLNKFHEMSPDVILVPSHCNVSTTNLVSTKFDMDAL